MTSWSWILSVGSAFFLMLYVAYSAYVKHRSDVHHVLLHGKQKPGADAGTDASDSGSDPLRGKEESNQAPTSVYHGQVYFFDSAEHRDMFEANDHEPVATGSTLLALQEQHGRRLHRQDAR